jgi:outer membrane scaffolding protein for murein synthesis (MipA/OmpV family)
LRFAIIVLSAVLVAWAVARPAHAETGELPLFEIGVFAAGGWVPDYPASNQNHLHALPLPYVIYRGESLQLSEAAARGILYAAPAVSFDLSASAAFNSSHDDRARMGMPGLDYTGQVGPRVNLLLASDARQAKLDIELPVRAVFSSNLSNFRFRGFVAAPELAYTNADFLGWGGRFKLGVGPEFATTRLMDYFYQVQAQFAAPGRPQYSASGGYLGTKIEASYRAPINDWMNAYALLTPAIYSGATNHGSPLFKKDYGVSAALGVSFSFYQSEMRASGEVE